jgi:CDP-6-deoxy-D-xylo-4-hexulose-3-dehydrase
LVQLEELEANTKIRERNFQKMTQIFGKYPEYFELPKRTTDSRSPWLAYPILIKQGSPFKRFQMQAFFEEKKIQTRTVFTGNILRQPAMKGVTFQGQKNSLPNSDRIMENGIVFGCHHGMTLAQIDYLASVLSDFLSSN